MIFHYAFAAESNGERILKIDQHLAKLWVVFYETRYRSNDMSGCTEISLKNCLLASRLSRSLKALSVWPHLFRGAGHEKKRGEQLKWSMAFRLYIGSFPCAQLPGPVHTARLGRVIFFVNLT